VFAQFGSIAVKPWASHQYQYFHFPFSVSVRQIQVCRIDYITQTTWFQYPKCVSAGAANALHMRGKYCVRLFGGCNDPDSCQDSPKYENRQTQKNLPVALYAIIR
jgi:hypothetical protein